MSVPLTVTVAGPDAAKFKEMIRKAAMEAGQSMSEWVTDACAEKLRRSVDGK